MDVTPFGAEIVKKIYYIFLHLKKIRRGVHRHPAECCSPLWLF